MAPNSVNNYNTFVRIGDKFANKLTGEIIEANTPKPTEGDEDGLEDLTLLNKVSGDCIITRNRFTGEYMIVNNKEARLSKMRKRVCAWAEVIKPIIDKNSGCQMLMIGLTYRPGEEWKANDIREFIISFKKKVGVKNIIAMARVGELQERGAVHYHIVVVVKRGIRIPKPDKSGLWRHGSSRVEVARSPFYLVSYTKKSYQKEGEFPKGLRMYDVWINPEYISFLEKWHFRLSTLPGWLKTEVIKDVDNIGSKWKRLVGGGWSFADRTLISPFAFIGIAYS